MLTKYAQVLRLPSYAWYRLTMLISEFGSQVGSLALVWVVTENVGAPTVLAAALALTQYPIALGSLLVGPLMDRLPRRMWMIIDNVGRGMLWLGFVAVALWHGGNVPVWSVYFAVTLAAFLSSFTLVGGYAITPALVGDSQLLPAANALNHMLSQAAYLLGPAVGGLLLTVWRPTSVVLVDAISFLLFAFALARLPRSVDQPGRVTANYWRSMAEGVRLLLRSRVLLRLTLLTVLFNMTYGPLYLSLPFFADRTLGTGAAGLGWLWTAFGVGMLAGGLLSGSDRLRLGHTLALVPAIFGLTTGAMAVTSTLWVATGLMFLAGTSYAPFAVLSRTAGQRLVPQEAYGRFFSLVTLLTQLGTPTGVLIGGQLLRPLGAPATIGLAGGAGVLLGLAALLSRDLRGMDYQAAESGAGSRQGRSKGPA